MTTLVGGETCDVGGGEHAVEVVMGGGSEGW